MPTAELSGAKPNIKEFDMQKNNSKAKDRKQTQRVWLPLQRIVSRWRTLKFEYFAPLKIQRDGFSLLYLKWQNLMKNVKPEYYGVKEIYGRSLLGIFVGKNYFTISIFYSRRLWKSKKNGYRKFFQII
jgi:hypothetical protein